VAETKLLPADKHRLLLTIDDCKGVVTAADAALQTGLPVAVVRLELNKLAEKTGGQLDVTAGGGVIYRFPLDLAAALHDSDAEIRMQELKELLQSIGFFILRVLFGAILLTTVWLFKPPWNQSRAVILYFVALFGVAWGETDPAAQFRRHNDEAYLKTADALGLGNILNVFSPHYRWRNRRLENALELLKPQPEQRERKATFITACFSFVFGDGNPNYLFDDLSWQAIAEVIRQNRGAVVYEQLAPYLNQGCGSADEEAIIPVLVRFQGYPEVTPTGNLVYVFPDYTSLIKSAPNVTLPSFIAEQEWKFSELAFPYLIPVWIVSSLIFCMSFIEWRHPEALVWLTWLPPGFMMWQLMLPFSSFFLVVPLCRFLLITLKNAQIDDRNRWREGQALILKNESGKLGRKMLEREAFIVLPASREQWKVEYTTAKDVLEQNDWKES
jgi:hypothetical protein